MSKLFSKLNESLDVPAQKHPLKAWHLIFLLLLIIGFVFIMRQNNNPQLVSQETAKQWDADKIKKTEGSVFGTIYHITYQSDKKLDNGIKAALDDVNNSLSMFEKNSIISHINDNTSMETDSMFRRVFTLAAEVSAATDGAFDITVAPLVNLWGFGFKNMDNVTESEVTRLIQYVGINNVSLKDNKIVKRYKETMLDCSAIAKGYGVDMVGEYLENVGIKNYMVEIGGEVRVRGYNPKGQKWSIGITQPEDDENCTQGDIQKVLSITDMSMATSGNYRNFYVKEGKKYAHTIDPRTGHPVQHNILSSTVLAKDCATADAFATSFMVLGLEKAKAVLEKHPELMAYFVCSTSDGKTTEWYSPKLQSLIKK